jgi:hypothetical protein
VSTALTSQDTIEHECVAATSASLLLEDLIEVQAWRPTLSAGRAAVRASSVNHAVDVVRSVPVGQEHRLPEPANAATSITSPDVAVRAGGSVAARPMFRQTRHKGSGPDRVSRHIPLCATAHPQSHPRR